MANSTKAEAPCYAIFSVLLHFLPLTPNIFLRTLFSKAVDVCTLGIFA
jgi:hypothetical protein